MYNSKFVIARVLFEIYTLAFLAVAFLSLLAKFLGREPVAPTMHLDFAGKWKEMKARTLFTRIIGWRFDVSSAAWPPLRAREDAPTFHASCR